MHWVAASFKPTRDTMSVNELDLPAGAALLSNPMQFHRLADDFEARWETGRNLVESLREHGTGYSSHEGPDIDVVVSGIDAVADGFISRIVGYSELSRSFRSAYNRLVSLEERSDTLGYQLSRLREQSPDDSNAAVQAETARTEFDAIRSEERLILQSLATDIETTQSGEDIAVDHAAWQNVITRIVDRGVNPEMKVDLQVGWVVLADHADGADVKGSQHIEMLLTERELTMDQAAKVVNGDLSKPVEQGVLDGSLAFPSPEISNKVATARITEQTSDEANIDARYFPPGYDDDIEELREIESQGWFGIGAADNDEQKRATEIRGRLGIDGSDDDVQRITIVSDVADDHAADEWKGRALSNEYERDYQPPGDPGNLPGRSGTDTLPKSHLSEEALLLLTQEIGESSDTAVSFYNGIGVEKTAHIPMFLSEQPKALEGFGTALALASNEKDAAGKPALSFGGDDVINVDDPQDISHFVYPPPDSLFLHGDYDEGFIVDATEASIIHPRRRWLESRFDADGVDPTNILLEQSTKYPGVPELVVARLDESDQLDMLLNPEFGFIPESNVGNPYEASYPVADFIAAAGDDKQTAGTLFVAAANEPGFSDPGVASGFDQVLGNHATVGYEEKYIEGHGIDVSNRLTRQDWLELGLGQTEWEQFQINVLEYGQGGGFVTGNGLLIQEAIANDLEDDGVLDGDYSKFGVTTGVAERNYVEASLKVQAQLDADAEYENKWAAATGSTVLAFSGMMPGVGLVGATGLSALDVALGWTGWAAPDETGNEERKLNELLKRYLSAPAGQRWAEMAAVEGMKAAQQRGETVYDTYGNEIRITNPPADSNKTYQLQILEDGKWVAVDISDVKFDSNDHLDEGSGVGQARSTAQTELDDYHTQGVNAADPGNNKASERDAEEINESALWVPLPTGGQLEAEQPGPEFGAPTEGD